ncbi:putative NADH-flavin reductase [Arthrobacter stackebrandtii]|uniref:NADH-flavin reductase n=1 Tax=Arthrobacter stackebrandtii TaxID=272161 RepID=A0ABS4YSJ0_9MICC|nr:NAD(P)H-binding protein [Arthrobacter stackebrandtii]MBP2411751.1 putative NADH-flavin reductase [Arthrobacter stackebrandtii]PYG99147.1 NAD-dependent epimerase [Arthrobacter stackebrandtii]
MANITVIGGTGYAGSHIVKEAAARGHKITSLSRKLPATQLDGVRYLQGDARDAASAIDGADVVIGALSPRAGSEGTLVETYKTIAAQTAAAGARLLVVGGFSSLRPAPGAPRFVEANDLPPEFAAEAAEMNSVLTSLESGAPDGLNWVFMSPAATFGAYQPDGEPRGTYRTSPGIALLDENGKSTIEGPDFALAVIDEVEKSVPSQGHLHFAN